MKSLQQTKNMFVCFIALQRFNELRSNCYKYGSNLFYCNDAMLSMILLCVILTLNRTKPMLNHFKKIQNLLDVDLIIVEGCLHDRVPDAVLRVLTYYILFYKSNFIKTQGSNYSKFKNKLRTMPVSA